MLADENSFESAFLENVTDKDVMQKTFTKAQKRKLERVRRDIKDRKSCLIYPEDRWKQNWDSFATVLLLFTCIVTPWRLAFYDENYGWDVAMGFIDSVFAIDIVI